jgi:SAM-dependent methyltransferase
MAETVSVLESVRSGQLVLADCPTVHYPEGDAAVLAQIERTHFWFVERRNVVWQFLSKAGIVARASQGEPIHGIDIGCGSGYTAAWLSGRGLPTVGVDVFPGFSQYSGQAAGFVQGDIMSIEPKGEFDFVLLLDTIEHIEDDGAFLSQAMKFLAPGGTLVISVPAFSWLWSYNDVVAQHQRRYTKASLTRLVKSTDRPLERLGLMYFYASTLPLYFASRRAPKASEAAQAMERAPHPFVNAALGNVVALERALLFPRGAPVGSTLFGAFRCT